MTQRHKILHICETAKGGVGTYLNNLAGLNSDRFEQLVVAPAPHADHLSGCGRVVTFESSGRGLRSVVAMLRAQRQVSRDFAPDVVMFHSTFSLAALLAHRLSRRRGRTIYCAHGWAVATMEGGAKKWLVRTVEGRLCGLASVVLNVSTAERDLAKAMGYAGRHVVIENAVPDLTREPKDDVFVATRDAINLLFVGRFDRQKGLDLLLPAFEKVRAERPDLHLHVVGASVRGARQDLTDAPGVTNWGWIGADRIDDFYRSADALVVPSRWEGLPLVLPEAMRNGTPVCISTRSGMAGLVQEGESGTSFELTQEGLTAMLRGLDATRLAAMRPGARLAFESRYDLPRLLNDVTDLIDGLGA